MNSNELRELADHHLGMEFTARTAARGLGDCPAAAQWYASAARHQGWAEQLTALAEAFDSGRPYFPPQP